MKCIEKAMTENARKPRKGWWGFTKDSYRFLMRYGHIIAAFNMETGKADYTYTCTRTDRAGLNNAITIWNKNERY